MPLLPEPQDVATVYEATSEFEAMTIRDLLESAGVRTMIRSRHVPGYDVATMVGDQAGIWADILVLPDQEDEARRLIADYLASLQATGEESEAP
ncbi:MAG: putative signal transducing protein [Armatimonadota bacterium]